MKTLAIGPVRDLPSWHWVGADTARALARHFDIALFDDFKRIPPSDVVMAIKLPPPLRCVRRLRARGSRLIYVPIDIYRDPAEIHGDAALLGACDLVLVHSELLGRHLGSYCRRVGFVEHHGKYTLPELAPYRPDGYVLWIGGLQNVPYLLKWLERNPLRRPLKILTDTGNRAAIVAAQRVGDAIGVKLRLGPASINGHETHPWSEAEQLRRLRECKAAIDIKGDDFNQRTKPPAKAQKFVSSGIPFACNLDSEVSRYFHDRGFSLASPAMEEIWYSEEYWRETRRFAAGLRERIELGAVGESYRAHLNEE